MAKIVVDVGVGKDGEGVHFQVNLEKNEKDNEQITAVAQVCTRAVVSSINKLIKLMEGELQLEEIVNARLGKNIEVPRIVVPPGFDPKKAN